MSSHTPAKRVGRETAQAGNLLSPDATLGFRDKSRINKRATTVQSRKSAVSLISTVSVYGQLAKVIFPGLTCQLAFVMALQITAGSLAGMGLVSESWVEGSVSRPTRGLVEIGPLRRCFTPEFQDSLCSNLSPSDSPNPHWRTAGVVLIIACLLHASTIMSTAVTASLPRVIYLARFCAGLTCVALTTGLIFVALGYGDLSNSCPTNTTLYTHCGLACESESGSEMEPASLCSPFSDSRGLYFMVAALCITFMITIILFLMTTKASRTPQMRRPPRSVSQHTLRLRQPSAAATEGQHRKSPALRMRPESGHAKVRRTRDR